MARMYTFHDGERFRAETNPTRGSMFVVCKCSGRSIYVRGEQRIKLENALSEGWDKFGFQANGDDVWQWIWLNCGFHRLARAEAV